jgi:hypothetical protein
MRASGAAILGAAVVAGAVLAASSAKANTDENDVDFDIDAEAELAANYYANAVTHPIEWSDGQLKSLEGLLSEFGMTTEAQNIRDLRIGLYGETNSPPLPLPEIFFIPPSQIDAIADAQEQELAEE